MDSQVPSGIFFSRIPHGKVMAGTEDAKVVAIPYPGLRPLNCSYSFKGGGIVAATTFPRITGECILYVIQLMSLNFSA